MGIRPSAGFNDKRKMKTGVKVFIVALVVVIGGLAYWYFFGPKYATPSGPTGSTNVLLPPPPAFEEYVLAFPEDPVMSEIVRAPFRPTWKSSINIPESVEVKVVGGFESHAPFPMTCTLPDRALVYQFGATVADGQSYMLAEYGGQEPVDDGADGITMYTVEGGCQIGMLFVPTDDMLFAYY